MRARRLRAVPRLPDAHCPCRTVHLHVSLGPRRWWFGEKVNVYVGLSLAMVVLGALLAGATDLSFDLEGYAWMAVNCASTAAYVLYMRGTVRAPLSAWDKAYLNNSISVPLSLVLALGIGEVSPRATSPGPAIAPPSWRGHGLPDDSGLVATVAPTGPTPSRTRAHPASPLSSPQFPDSVTSPELSTPAFVLALVLSGCVGFALNLTSLWCVSETSATTYSMVGALNKVPLAVLGTLLFGAPMDARSGLMVAFGLTAGAVYAYAKTIDPDRSPPTPQSLVRVSPMLEPAKAKTPPSPI